MRSKNSTHLTRTVGARVIGLVGVSVAAAAMLIAARHASMPAGTPAVETQPPQVEPTRKEPAANEPTKKMPVARAQAKMTAVSKAPAAGALPAKMSTDEAAATKAPVVETASKTIVQEPPVVTITGCLERDDETFRLKDTTGLDAPKSRSWKSGFLKKGSASVEVVDAAHRLHLTNHIGQRVSITGMLVDREMEGRTLRRVAASCD